MRKRRNPIRAFSPRPSKGRPLGALGHYGQGKVVDDSELRAYLVRLGQNIRDARLERDLSLVEMQRCTRYNITYLSRVERGLRSPNVKIVVRLARAMDMLPSELIP